MEAYMDEKLTAQERAEDLLGKMDLEEKLRQLGCTMILPMLPKNMQDLDGGIGVSIIMGGENPAMDLKEAQEYIMEHSPHHIPALFHGEALSGPCPILGGSVYPASIGLGAAFEPEILEEMSDATRKQMLAIGVRHGLSPVADLARDLRWGRTNETYGNDPVLSAKMTVSFVKGLQGENLKEGVAATGKHFLGYSQTEGGLNCHKTMVSPRELREQYAKPFEAAIRDADIKTIMNSYSAIDGQPVCASREILTDLLRDDLGFDGMVISDYGSITQLMEPYHMTDDMTEAGIRCLEAGLDVECPGRAGYADHLVKAVNDGRLSMETIDRAVMRVLTLKFELGLFENPFPRFDLLESVMDNTQYNAGSYRAAQKSITLAKNNGILPVTDRRKKILVAGPAGNCLRMLFSHYTAVASAEMMANLAVEGDTQQGYDIGSLISQAGGDDGNAMENLMNLAGDMNSRDITDKYVIDDMIRKLYPEAKTTFEALKEVFEDAVFIEGCDYKGTDDSHIPEAVEAAKDVDIVILAVGGKNGLGQSATTGEGVDSVSLDLPGQQEKLMREVFLANPNMVIVHTDARPLVSEWAYENVPAIIEGWLPNIFGGNALADVISGAYNPAGRMPVDVPRSAGHLPVYHCQANGSSGAKNRGVVASGYIDADASVLAPFGYGLSYTEFSYQDVSLTVQEDTGDAVLKVTVTNTGACDGEEVVQLYGSDLLASMIRPIHELIGFKRVALKAGERKVAEFHFNTDFFAFLSQNGRWILEKGYFRFFVGSHSDDVKGEVLYFLNETKEINKAARCLYARESVR